MADLKGVGGRATVIRTYYENKIYFKLKKNRKKYKIRKKKVNQELVVETS